MGIFDEAIREHLELKRQHGAAEPELQELEDEAFGPPARPGASASETAVAEPPPIADEAPTTIQPTEPVGESPEPVPEAEPPEEAGEPLPEPAETSSVRAETEEHPPPEGVVEPEEPLAAEEPVASDPPPEPGETALVDQPTEFYDVEGGGAADSAEGEVEDEFFSEQSLSDELDQALDAPDGARAPDPGEPPSIADEDPEPAAEAAPEPLPEEPVTEGEAGGEKGEEEEDVLEETPEFLQDTPENDRLWFEQKPPKDFDFDE